MSNNPVQYSADKLAHFKTIIVEELTTIRAELERYKEDRAKQKEHVSNTDVDFNESSKHFQEKAKNKQLINRLQRKSREYKSALSRIENKVYGVCDRSGKLIREDRLKAMPTARFDILKK